LGGLDDDEELFGTLVTSLGPNLRDEMYKWMRTGHRLRERETASSFEYFKRLVTQRYRSVLIVIDEIDSLIDRDRGKSWATLRKLQALIDAQKRDARGAAGGSTTVVLCGFKELYYAQYDNAFPFYDRCRPLMLQNLSKEATAKLILDPIKELGIPIVNEGDVTNRIFYATGGMPSIVQSICKEVVRRADDKEVPQLTPELVESIFGSENLMLLENYLRWIDYSADQMEQALLYFAAPLPRFSVDQFVEHLQNEGVKDIGLERLRQPLDNLTLANLFRVVDRHRSYEFAVEALQKALRERSDREDALKRLIKRIRDERPQ
jgi:tetratricopeptide (TPR) repeat protein